MTRDYAKDVSNHFQDFMYPKGKMTVKELSRDQLNELKQAYASKKKGEDGINYSELAEATSIPDEVIFNHYDGIFFSVDDFTSPQLYFYELCFYHDEDDSLATKERCSYCIKTEIPPVIDDDAALAILFSGDSIPNADELKEHLTCVMEIAPSEAESYFDMDGLTERVDSPYGVYYRRKR